MEDVAAFRPCDAPLHNLPSTTAIPISSGSTNGSASSDSNPAAGVMDPGETAAGGGTARGISSLNGNAGLRHSSRAVTGRHVRTRARARGVCRGLKRLQKGQWQAARAASATRAWQEAINCRLDRLQVAILQQHALLERQQGHFSVLLPPRDSESAEKARSTSPQSLTGSTTAPNLPQQQHPPPCLADAGTPEAVSRRSGLLPQPKMANFLPITARKMQATSRKNPSPAVAASDTSSATACAEPVTAQSVVIEQTTTPASDFERSDHSTPPQQQQQPAQWPLAAAAVATDISNWLVGGMTGMTSPLLSSSPPNSLHKQ